MRVIIRLANGPMGGSEWDMDLESWPPPHRMIGYDINPQLCGTYELQPGMTLVRTAPLLIKLTYRLRDDDDYRRVYEGWAKSQVLRQETDETL